MRYVVGNAKFKEVIHATSDTAAFDEFIRLHPEAVNNGMYLVKKVED